MSAYDYYWNQKAVIEPPKTHLLMTLWIRAGKMELNMEAH
jgi:hypothetical protein